MDNGMFIKTQDTETASFLRAEGFKELAKEGKYFVFANASDLKFSKNIDQKNIMYTNKLCI